MRLSKGIIRLLIPQISTMCVVFNGQFLKESKWKIIDYIIMIKVLQQVERFFNYLFFSFVRLPE